MPKASQTSAARQIHHLLAQGMAIGLSDAQLLERFASARDEASFEMLVARHGPMVLGVCLGVLHNSHDTEDAFQATFLVLARKAGSLWVKGSPASWLYPIALWIAVKAKADVARRRRHERQATRAKEREDAASAPPEPDLIPMLCREIERLPENYRAPVIRWSAMASILGFAKW
jgi:DNA-directed RNA polymerase specialized sigma24 family protein